MRKRRRTRALSPIPKEFFFLPAVVASGEEKRRKKRSDVSGRDKISRVTCHFHPRTPALFFSHSLAPERRKEMVDGANGTASGNFSLPLSLSLSHPGFHARRVEA